MSINLSAFRVWVLLGAMASVSFAASPSGVPQIGRFPRGTHNAITDVKGVKVGHKTLNIGEGRLKVGAGPVRTGVTVIVPGEDLWNKKMMAGSFVLNGNGEAAGLMWVQESGILETPIALTNTLSVGTVQDALVKWMLKKYPLIGIDDDTLTPIVFECDDSTLNDIRGQHVSTSHVLEALDSAKGGVVEQGNVGSGTGLITYDYKGGIGTSSRVLPKDVGGYTLGVLVNANHGDKHQLRIHNKKPEGARTGQRPARKPHQDGSIVVIIATDAPLDARQLSRISKRAMLGIARTGAIASHGSGDVALAFSTANRVPHYPKKRSFSMELLSDFHIDPLFEAVADAAEEALLNALYSAKTMVGRDGNRVEAFQ